MSVISRETSRQSISVSSRVKGSAHYTDWPVCIHVLEGEAVFEALGRKYPLSVRDQLVLAAGVEHSASSVPGCVFLLTVVHRPSAGSAFVFSVEGVSCKTNLCGCAPLPLRPISDAESASGKISALVSYGGWPKIS